MPVVTWLEPGEGTQYPLRLKTRLRAWWEGYDLSSLRLAASTVEEAVEIIREMPAIDVNDNEPLTRFGKPLWTASRIKVAETLWGVDHLSPGGVEHTTYLVKPFNINSSMSILDLAAGLGGAARTIATDYKAWVTGMEASPMVAKIAMERSEKMGLGKQATIQAYDPNLFQLNRRYDGIFAKEAFFTVEDKEHLFDVIAGSVKSGGQFLFTDYCVETETFDDPRLAQWIVKEPIKPVLWSANRLKAALKARKLDVRINEDITNTQRRLVLSALGHFLQHLDAHSMDHETKSAVLDEVELWARRMAAFDAGLRVYRFYCMNH